MVEMTVAGLALDPSNRSPIVLLRDPSGHRQVPIWINHDQAHNIISGLKQTQGNRPLTHDLMVSLLNAGNLLLERVIIHEIAGNTFQAVLKLRLKTSPDRMKGKGSHAPFEIEARSSDAIALAVRTKCSIWMLEKVVAEASIPVDEIADEEDQDEFRRFLDDVSPADLIRHLKENDQNNEPPFDSPNSNSTNQR